VCHYVTQKQALQMNVQNVLSSSPASQHEGTTAQAQLLDPTQPNPWVNPTHGQLVQFNPGIGSDFFSVTESLISGTLCLHLLTSQVLLHSKYP